MFASFGLKITKDIPWIYPRYFSKTPSFPSTNPCLSLINLQQIGKRMIGINNVCYITWSSYGHKAPPFENIENDHVQDQEWHINLLYRVKIGSNIISRFVTTPWLSTIGSFQKDSTSSSCPSFFLYVQIAQNPELEFTSSSS